jgi:cytochrome P450
LSVSFRSTVDREPYEFYEHVRTLGGIVWDDEMNGLLVGSYDVVRDTLRRDTRRFVKVEGDRAETDPVFLAVKGGPRAIELLHGEAHKVFHKWWLDVVSRRSVAEWQRLLIRPLVDRTIDRFADRGRAELVAELTEQVPVRVITSLLGLPSDDDFLESFRVYMDARMEYIEAIQSRPPNLDEIGAHSMAVAIEFKERIRAFAERGPLPDSDDLITAYWNDGPSIFPDWGIDDVTTGVITAFFAGSHTTSTAMTNGLYLLMTRPELQESLRTGGEKAIEAFVEEALRIYGVGHLNVRRAAEDCEVGGIHVPEGTTVYSLLAAANLDPDHYDRPWEVDLSRPGPRDHTAFLMGPRACGGMWLARGELAVLYSSVVERLRDLRLDPNEVAPRMRGFLGRAFTPLHASFTPAAQLANACSAD